MRGRGPAPCAGVRGRGGPRPPNGKAKRFPNICREREILPRGGIAFRGKEVGGGVVRSLVGKSMAANGAMHAGKSAGLEKRGAQVGGRCWERGGAGRVAGGPGCPATISHWCAVEAKERGAARRGTARRAARRGKKAGLNSRGRGAYVVPAPAHVESRLPVCLPPAWRAGRRQDFRGRGRSFIGWLGSSERALRRQRRQRRYACAMVCVRAEWSGEQCWQCQSPVRPGDGGRGGAALNQGQQAGLSLVLSLSPSCCAVLCLSGCSVPL